MAEVKVGILIQAIDDASDEMQKVGNSANAMAGAVEQSSSRIETANTKSSFSLKSLGTSISGLMTSVTSLVFAYDRVEKAQYTVNRATNLLEDTTRRVQKAQEAYNAAVEKFGADSPQAEAAATTLKAAQDDLTLAGERLSIAQQNMNQAMISTALMVIPTVITGITSLQGVIGAFSAFLATNPMGWLIIAFAAIAALITALVTNFMGFRDAVIGVFTTVYNAIKPVIDAIIGIINTLVGIISAAINAIMSFLSWLGKAAGAKAPTAPATPGVPSPTPPPIGGGCFLAGTKITMSDGSFKNIEDVGVGDLVQSWSDGAGVQGKVVRVYHHTPGETGRFYLVINDRLKVTPNHTVWADDGWVKTEKLRLKSKLLNVNGDPVVVNSIKRCDGSEPSYNLEVEKHHTYFADGILVHNIKAYQFGGFVEEAGLAYLHRHEWIIPEAKASPLPAAGGLTIHGPLIVIEGSADEATARKASELVVSELRRLIR